MYFSKGEYYRIEMYEKDHKGKLSPVSKLELKNQLDFIVNDTKGNIGFMQEYFTLNRNIYISIKLDQYRNYSYIVNMFGRSSFY